MKWLNLSSPTRSVFAALVPSLADVFRRRIQRAARVRQAGLRQEGAVTSPKEVNGNILQPRDSRRAGPRQYAARSGGGRMTGRAYTAAGQNGTLVDHPRNGHFCAFLGLMARCANPPRIGEIKPHIAFRTQINILKPTECAKKFGK